jgi:hypothetical protein
MTSRIDSLREALAVSPQNIPLLLLFGHACADELSFAEARAAFDRILQSDPFHVEAKLGIARVLYLSGNISEAVVRAEALTINPASQQPGCCFPDWQSRKEIVPGRAILPEAVKLSPV